MECRHPAIVAGRCLTCGALLTAENGPNDAMHTEGGQIPTSTPTPTETGQKPATKGTRKRKA